MARLRRYVILSQPQHIIQRGNNQQVVFAVGEYGFSTKTIKPKPPSF